MVFPSPEQQRGISLEKVESVGVFRCPNCAEVEKENEQLKKTLAETYAKLEKIEDNLKKLEKWISNAKG